MEESYVSLNVCRLIFVKALWRGVKQRAFDSGDFRLDHCALFLRSIKPNFGEMFGSPYIGALCQNGATLTNLGVQVPLGCLFAFVTKPSGAILDGASVDLRHARGRRAGAGRVGEDVQPRQVAVIDKAERVLEHLFGSGWEARDNIRAERHIGAQRFGILTKPDRIVAQVASFHAFEDHIVARLQGQVEVRH